MMLRPADVRVGDRVLVNGSWWLVAGIRHDAGLASGRVEIVVSHEGDELVLWRDVDQLVDVDRPGNRWPWEAA